MTQPKFALLGANPSRARECTLLYEYEIYNATDDKECPRGIKEEWNNDDEFRIRGILVYTIPAVSAELRRVKQRRTDRS
jgi:hypothetical protein